MKKKEKKLLDYLPYDLRPMMIELYFIYMLCIYPFIMDNKLFNVTVTRFYSFVAGACVLLIVIIELTILRKVPLKRIYGFCASTALKLFLVGCVISTVLSSDWMESVLGKHCRYIGLIFYALILVVYLLIKRFYQPSRWFLIFMTVGGMAVIGLGILNHAGIDPLHTLEGIAEKFENDYLSTIGQMNFFSEYVLMVFGACGAGYLTAQKRSRSPWLFAVFICGCGIFVGKSDGAALGLIVGLILMPLFFAKQKRREFLRRYCWMIAVLILGMAAIAFWTRYGSASFLSLKGMYKRVLNYPWKLLYPVVVFSVLALLITYVKVSEEALCKWTQRIYLCLLVIGIVGVTVMVIAGNTGIVRSDSYLYKWFHFSKTWGTDRGAVWMEAIQIFEDGSVLQKLFGHGLACTDALLVKNSDFDNVHNELLQYLLTVGIFGMMCYVVFVVTSIYRSIKSQSDVVKGAGLMMLMYSANSLVSLAQPLTTPYLFLAGSVIAAGVVRERRI